MRVSDSKNIQKAAHFVYMYIMKKFRITAKRMPNCLKGKMNSAFKLPRSVLYLARIEIFSAYGRQIPKISLMILILYICNTYYVCINQMST